MIINFWDCEFSEYESLNNEEGHLYTCNHLDNDEGFCSLDNKYSNKKDNCELLNG